MTHRHGEYFSTKSSSYKGELKLTLLHFMYVLLTVGIPRDDRTGDLYTLLLVDYIQEGNVCSQRQVLVDLLTNGENEDRIG